ncbi:MAG TPA: amino acid permease [Candidatus Acidoferrum sp.]|nr:amino acid permease [Candidatus Acidoferrum sp.]
MDKASKSQKLDFFDVTNLVVGTAIGADIYVITALGCGYLGPANLVAWIVGGAIAIIFALIFAECAALIPNVGGAYAYAREAWGNFTGFVVGWGLWIAEVAALAVMPVAFVRYLTFFIPSLTWIQGVPIKVLFVVVFTYVNIRGTKLAGRTNDVLTIAKVSPLLLLIIMGLVYLGAHPAQTYSNFIPFAPLGYSNFAPALILAFWAYTGFELAVVPSNEIDNPQITIPKAMIIGMTIVIFVYILTNFVAIGAINWTTLQFDQAPLASAGSVVLSYTPALAVIGGTILGIGALLSISGYDESGTLATARLSYAISIDGLFPKFFSQIHPKYGTPYKSILAQSAIALFASLIGGLSQLIVFATFNLAFVYLVTSSVVFVLREKRKPEVGQTVVEKMTGPIIPITGILLSAYMLLICGTTTIFFGIITILIGVPIYVAHTPRTEMETLKKEFYSTEAILSRVSRTQKVFLGYLLKLLREYMRRE